MKRFTSMLMLAALTAFTATGAHADEYADTIAVFKSAGKSAEYFKTAYGYAVFPTVGKAGFVVGASHGDGHVYEKGKYVGNASITGMSLGFQAGAAAHQQIIFFHKKEDLDKFKAGNFELGAGVEATAVTASASASAGTGGAQASASSSQDDAKTGGGYNSGIAVFTVAKGGLMGGAAVGGQKFKYKPK